MRKVEQAVQEASAMKQRHPRMTRESRTIQAMIEIYCRAHHGDHGTRSGLCSECGELLYYAELRLDKCPFQEHKTTCTNCPVHCYKPSVREKVKEIMRYSGPRMTFRHPVLALCHLLDGRRKAASSKSKADLSS
jgi:hypothetical protein